MKYNMQSRFYAFFVAVVVMFSLIFLKITYLTIFSGDLFSRREASFVYKKIEVKAPRGEIRDRYGRLLAGNRPSFNVQLSRNNSLSQEEQNNAILKIISILKQNNEKIVDEFPIKIDANNYYYFTYDEELRKWKEKNNIDPNASAKESFTLIANLLVEQGVIRIDKDTTSKEIQQKMIAAGYYPPISIQQEMKFSHQVKKEEWIQKNFPKEYKQYLNKPAKEIFQLLREKNKISSSMDARTARDMLNVLNILKMQSYQYQPVGISFDIKNNTVIQLEEASQDIPMVSVVVEPVRYYPHGNFASHILGYLGKISDNEIQEYVRDKKYNPSDIIGKTGIEKTFEEQLRGKAGYQEVQVDSRNRMVGNLGFQNAEPGDTIYLTLDYKLQKTVEDTLKKTLGCIQNGSDYQSDWGNIRMRENKKVFYKAQSGATIVMDVNTGKILAMASYPDYDPNKFVHGISQEDYELLMPKNLNDPMSPKPLFNIATMMSVQPGSTFKMITGLAALENGLSPYYRIQDKGSIKIGNHSFGCWIWNSSGHSQTHGMENLMDAIQDSCNYYFYCLSVGYDYSVDKPLPISMNSQKILDYATKFGLNEKTGIEIEETKGSVPTVGMEREKKVIALKNFLKEFLADKFEDIDSNSGEYITRINTIISWADENPSRGELIRRLREIKVKEKELNNVTDRIKYDYFISMGGWKEGDAFNLAIGQGAHSYTPLQLTRYVASIANKGNLNKVSLIDKRENYEKTDIIRHELETEVIQLKNNKNLEYLVQGMKNASDEGTSKNTFNRFPIMVASKTGTAQRAGKIPTVDEKKYYLSHLSSYGVNYSDVMRVAEELEKNSKTKLQDYQYIVQAILKLNKNLKKADLDQYKDSYDEFAWFVSFAPAEKPEIAVISVIVQGGHGGYAAPMARDIYAQYFELTPYGTKPQETIQKKIQFLDELN